MEPPPPPTTIENMGRARPASISSTFSSLTEGDGFPESVYSSPNSTQLSPSSPADPLQDSLKDATDGGSTGLSDLDPASGPQRSRSASHSGHAGPSENKEKRKRSRVTPEQLAHLERLFATDRSPTAARRKEISEMLGMHERQTQIWFQNRRAKAKLQETRKEQGDGEHGADLAPALVAGSDAELSYLVHEDEPISVIPCIELSIGTWKRVVSGPGKFDLVAYSCESQKRLTWYIYSGGQGFKMEVPFGIILDSKFTSTATAGMGQASFVLSQPPIFYLESILPTADLLSGTAPVRTWRRCADWTEGMQASSVLQHNLVGAAVQLAHVLRNIAAYTAGPSIPLYPPTYHATPHLASTDPHTPPMVALAVQGCDGPSQSPRYAYTDFGLRRRFSTPAMMQSYPTGRFPTNALPPEYRDADAGPPPVSTYAEMSSIGAGLPGGQQATYMSSSADDFPRLPISQTMSRRSFAEPSPSYAEMRQGLSSPYGDRPSSLHSLRPSPLFAAEGAYGMRPPADWQQPGTDSPAMSYTAGDMQASSASSSPPSRGSLQYPAEGYR